LKSTSLWPDMASQPSLLVERLVLGRAILFCEPVITGQQRNETNCQQHERHQATHDASEVLPPSEHSPDTENDHDDSKHEMLHGSSCIGSTEQLTYLAK